MHGKLNFDRVEKIYRRYILAAEIFVFLRVFPLYRTVNYYLSARVKVQNEAS